MKLAQYGDRGMEFPGIIDSDGQLRSIAGFVQDGISGLGVQEQRVVAAS